MGLRMGSVSGNRKIVHNTSGSKTNIFLTVGRTGQKPVQMFHVLWELGNMLMCDLFCKSPRAQLDISGGWYATNEWLMSAKINHYKISKAILLQLTILFQKLDSFHDFLCKWNLDHFLGETHLLGLILLSSSPLPGRREDELFGNW